MSRDYGNPQYRAETGNADEQSVMRQAMASAHASYTANSMNGECVEVYVDVDMSVFGEYRFCDSDNRCAQMMGVVFNSCFARFRAEGRYGEMSMSWANGGGTSYRDTY